MDVYIQIHCPAESLNDGGGAAAPVHDPSQVSHVAQETEHGPNGNTHDGATQVVIPRQPVPKPMWERQDPLHPSAAAALGAPALSHRHRREHVVHQAGVPAARLLRGGVEVRSAFRHPASGAARAGRPPFARKRNEPIQPTVITAKTREAAGHPSTSLGMALSLVEGPGTRIAATRETPARRIGAALPRRADQRPARGSSRSDRGPPGTRRPATTSAAHTSSRVATRLRVWRIACHMPHLPLPRRWLEPAGTEETSKRVAAQALVAGQHTPDVTITSSRV